MFLKCIKMKQVNTANNKANNMFMDEWDSSLKKQQQQQVANNL